LISGQKISADTLIIADWIIPVIPASTVMHNAAIAIKGSRIVALMSAEEAAASIDAQHTITLKNQVLIPGLVNSHGHIAMSLFRGIAEDIPLKQWLEERIWPLESQFVSPAFVNDGSNLAIAEMIRGGTTCFADNYFFPEEVASVATSAGIRTQLACPVLDFPTAWAQDPQEYISKTTALHDRYRHSELIHVAFGPHSTYSVADDPLESIRVLADELDIPIHMHIHETAQEVHDALILDGRRPLQRLADLNLISPRLVCTHMTTLNDGEIAQIAELGAHVVHCPESNLKLASGFCEVAKLIDRGVNVALGTDGGASNNDLDMFGEMHTAALLAKAVAGDPSAVNAHQILEMATINGAKAMGLAEGIGSLEVGKYADITAVDLDQLNTLPMHNAASHIVYAANSRQVSYVWCAGKMLLENGQHKTVNIPQLREATTKWQRRFKDM
jgi:5-methylthioadenosine/S-adenosylhomocysteine deaminase